RSFAPRDILQRCQYRALSASLTGGHATVIRVTDRNLGHVIPGSWISARLHPIGMPRRRSGSPSFATSDCLAMLKDRRLRRVGMDPLIAQGVPGGPLFEMCRRFVLNNEGPSHDRLRRLLSPAFSTAAIRRLRPRMREIVHGLVDRFAADGA